MKHLKPINKRLIVGPAILAISLFSLTSFNPFSQTLRNSDGNASLASELARGKIQKRNRGAAPTTEEAKRVQIDVLRSEQTAATQELTTHNENTNMSAPSIPSASSATEAPATGNTQNSKLSGFEDIIGNCDKEDSDRSPTIQRLCDALKSNEASSKIKKDSCSEKENFREVRYCYEDQIKLAETDQAKKDILLDIEETIEGLIQEDPIDITRIKELEKFSRDRKFSKFSEIKRNIRKLVTEAIAYDTASKQMQQYEKNLQAQASQIGQIDNQINFLKLNYPNNPGAQFQLNQLYIQRKNLEINLQNSATSLKGYLTSNFKVDALGTSDSMRDFRERIGNNYADIVSPYGSVFTDKSLLDLNKPSTVPALTIPTQTHSTISTSPIQQSPQANSQNPWVPLSNAQGNQIQYSSLDPNMVNAKTQSVPGVTTPNYQNWLPQQRI